MIELKTSFRPVREAHIYDTFEHHSWKFRFHNGYGASVVCIIYKGRVISEGNDRMPFELAVLKDDKICYDTPITDNILGYLTEKHVEKILKEIEII